MLAGLRKNYYLNDFHKIWWKGDTRAVKVTILVVIRITLRYGYG